jgi:hypothetical protein
MRTPISLVLVLVACVLVAPGAARAVPSFAEQTGQPCAACHVGAFGPQLRPFGRAFKLNGYVASDGKRHFPPIAATAYASFTHTQKDQPGAAARWFADNNNVALDQASLYYAGAITRHLGGFIQTTYDGVARQYQIDNTDIRYARERDIFGIDSVWGLTLNNNPTVSDLWNSTPVWGFPYNGSPLAPTPLAATRIDGSFSEQVLGVGAYVMWNDWVYTEAALYRGLGRDVRNALGTVPVAGTDSVVDMAPYWRLAVQHDHGRSNWEIGTYGIDASILPGGALPGAGADHYTDVAADANWQFTFHPRAVASDVISAHATIITEDQHFAASALPGSAVGNLTTVRADISYSMAATVTPSAQWFSTTGSAGGVNAATPAGRPDSSGAVLELAYSPFGKPDSLISWGNLRFAVQYVLYTKFDGQTTRAANNNTVYLSAWAAWHF